MKSPLDRRGSAPRRARGTAARTGSPADRSSSPPTLPRGTYAVGSSVHSAKAHQIELLQTFDDPLGASALELRTRSGAGEDTDERDARIARRLDVHHGVANIHAVV